MLGNRMRHKERRARRLWRSRRRRAALLWGMQALEIQAARRWAHRTHQGMTIDLWRRRFLLKWGLRNLISAGRDRELINATYVNTRITKERAS